MILNYHLDVKDRKILAQLDTDARQSFNQIGKKVGLSKEVIKYRIDRLQEQDIIVRFHTVVNYFKLGVVKFKLYLRLTNANKEKLEEIAQYFFKNHSTEWVVLTTGRWDLMAGFMVHNVNEFDEEVQKALNLFSSHIQEKAVTTTLHVAHETRGFLQKGQYKKTKVIYHTSKDPQEKIDETDEEILRIITNNARMPVTEIAQKVHTTPRVVQYRLRELERKKIILAYKAHLNPRAMGRIFCKAIIYLSTATEQRVKSFIGYASSLPGAVWPQRVMGAWDFELDLEVESYDVFQKIILDLKEKFPDLIRNHEFCIASKEYKLDLYPNAQKELHHQ